MFGDSRYKIIGVLGQGGMGTVYAAEDRRLPGKRWAIKEIRANETGLDSLSKEAEMLVRLSHPNLPHIADYFVSEDASCGYLVMEFIEGETLEERFEKKGRKLAIHEILRYAVQICNALAYLHAAEPGPIVHRDLKPSNILIDRNGRVVLIDFGTARNYKAGSLRDTVQIGTIGFAAPEQLADGQTDPRTDLYTLGAILFYLLSGGRSPLGVAGSRETMMEGVSYPLSQVVERLLSPSKEDRYPNAEAVKEELERIESLLKDEENHPVKNRSKIGIVPRKRIIALLSLYPGAGSTTVGLTAAALLGRLRIAHTYLEHPAVDPVLGNWLGAGSSRTRSRTNWLLADAFPADRSEWNAEAQLKLLFEQETPIILVDLSHAWEDGTVHALLQLADEVVIVAGPRRMQLMRTKIRLQLEKLAFLSDERKRLTLLWNGSEKSYQSAVISSEVAFQGKFHLPYCDDLSRFEWSGDPELLIRDSSYADWCGKLERWLLPLLEEWGYGRQLKPASGGWLTKWMKKG